MKKQTLIALFINCALTTLVYAAPFDRIVAVVNDDVVTQSEVAQNLSVVKMQLTQAHQPIPSHDELQKQVTNQLINKKLQLQMAKMAGIKVTDHEIDQVVERIATQNNISVEELYKRISQEGLSKTHYRNELQEQVTIQRVQQQEAGGRLSVTPEEINQALKSISVASRSRDYSYHLEDILIPIDSDSPKEQLASAHTKAQKLIANLQHNGYQKKLVTSKDYQYTDLGWLQLNDMPSAFVDDVKRMQKNSVAGPIQTGNGFHILHLAQLKSIASGNTNELSRKQVEDRLLQQKFMENAERWVAKMRGQAYIKVNQTS